VPPLWHFYQNILEIQSPEQLDVTLFDVCHAMPRVAPASLSMGMFWCRPDIWISVDKKNRELAATKGVNRKNARTVRRVLFRAYRPVRAIQCLPPCRVLAMPVACAHAAHVGAPAAFGAWRITVWNAMVFE
jgi:hypothetical protein